MKRYVDGVERDLDPTAATAHRLGDRLLVRTPQGARSALVVVEPHRTLVSYLGRQYVVEHVRRVSRAAAGVASGELRAPMPGAIVDVNAIEGARVQKGDKLVVLEAMKTQQSFVAPFDGVVQKVGVTKGEQVEEGQILVVVVAAEAN